MFYAIGGDVRANSQTLWSYDQGDVDNDYSLGRVLLPKLVPKPIIVRFFSIAFACC